jgi:hypothetical protein
MKDKIKKTVPPQAATPAVSQQTKDSVTQTAADSNDSLTTSSCVTAPVTYEFNETAYEPPLEISQKEISRLTDNDLLTGLKKQYDNTRMTYEGYKHDGGNLVLFIDTVIARYKDARVAGAKRDGKPTVREAFAAIGWSYDAARQAKSRFKQNLLPQYAKRPRLKLAAGDVVKDGSGNEYVVDHNHVTVDFVELLGEDGDGATRVIAPIYDLDGDPIFKKVNPRKVKVGDRLLCQDNGKEYVYSGGGIFARRDARAAAPPPPATTPAAVLACKEYEVSDNNSVDTAIQVEAKDDREARRDKLNAKSAAEEGAAAASKTDQPPTTKDGGKTCVTCGDEFKAKPHNLGRITQCDGCGAKDEVPVLKGFTEVEGSKGTTRTVVPVSPDVFDRATKQARTGSVKTN